MNDNRYKDGKSMKSSVDDYLRALGIDKKVKEATVLAKWGELMGDAVEKRTKNIYIRERVLYLEINSSVMRDELMQSKSKIIERINKEADFELITKVFFK